MQVKYFINTNCHELDVCLGAGARPYCYIHMQSTWRLVKDDEVISEQSSAGDSFYQYIWAKELAMQCDGGEKLFPGIPL